MKISEIRETIERLNWARNWFTGGTAEEFRRHQLPVELAPYIAEVAALEIPARFAEDRKRQVSALQGAAAILKRWAAAQERAAVKQEKAVATVDPDPDQAERVFLVDALKTHCRRLGRPVPTDAEFAQATLDQLRGAVEKLAAATFNSMNPPNALTK